MGAGSWGAALALVYSARHRAHVAGLVLRGSFLAAHNLAVLHASLGADADAARWREREALLRHAG